MKKLFWEDPYCSYITTTVANVNGNELLFTETIAYSFAGGQESDAAFINGMPVMSSRRDGNLIYYMLAEGHGLKFGEQVEMTIDWPRRSNLMRLHFAAELILEIVTQKYSFEKIGAHISQTKSRIDFISPESITSKLPEIIFAYNEIIAKNLSIEKGYSDESAQRRYWKIDGFAQVPCGGTHVARTGEVGYVTLKREHPGKSIERIEIRLIDNAPLEQHKTEKD